MFLRGAGRPTHAIAAGAAADEQDDVARGRGTAENVGARDGGNHGADFHALGDVAGVIDFRDLAGGEADLVAVGRVTFCSDLADFFLRELARQGLGKRRARVAGTGDTHCLIDVGSPGKRIADAAAETGGGTAEGLDLGGVVVSLVFEHHEPLFRLRIED